MQTHHDAVTNSSNSNITQEKTNGTAVSQRRRCTLEIVDE